MLEGVGSLSSTGYSRLNLAEIRSDQGTWESSLAIMHRVRRMWVAGHHRFAVAYTGSVMARTLARLGDFEAATREAGTAADRFAELGASEQWLEARLRDVEALWLGGKINEARARLAALGAVDGELQAFALTLLGGLEASVGDETASSTLARAHEAAVGCGRWFDQLVCLCLLAQVDGPASPRWHLVGPLATQLGIRRIRLPDGVLTIDGRQLEPTSGSRGDQP